MVYIYIYEYIPVYHISGASNLGPTMTRGVMFSGGRYKKRKFCCVKLFGAMYQIIWCYVSNYLVKYINYLVQ